MSATTARRCAGADNRPLAGAQIEVFEVDPATGARRGAAVHGQKLSADGRWGPALVAPNQALEFVITAQGYAITHVYRSPFPRSSNVVNFRAERLAEADRAAKSVVSLVRPRGYFGIPRDQIVFDGNSPPAGLPRGVAGLASAKLRLQDEPGRPISASFESGALKERLVGVTWPAAQDHAVVLELHN